MTWLTQRDRQPEVMDQPDLDERLHRQALAEIEQLLGKEHPQAAYVITDLAFLFYEQGRYADAEPLYRRALEIREKALEKNHPDVAASLGYMAFVLSECRSHATKRQGDQEEIPVHAAAPSSGRTVKT